MHRILSLVVLLLLVISEAAQAQTGPGLTVAAPAQGTTIQGLTVTVSFQVAGSKLVPSLVPLTEAGKRPDANRPGEGHLHIMLDLQPLIVWDQDAPYTFNNVPPGEHQLMVELVNNDHSPLSPPVVQQIRFRTAMMMPTTGVQSTWQVAKYPGLLLVTLSLVICGWLFRCRSFAVHS